MSTSTATPKRKTLVKPTGPRTLKGSPEARRQAALVLEALTGVRTTQEAADAMGIAITRYYVLETRALAGFIEALEPRRRGRRVTPEREHEKLRTEQTRLEQEVRRYQALYRTAQRAMGVAAIPVAAKGSSKKKTAKTRRRRKKARAEVVLATLAETTSEEGGGES